jgi:bacterioferritin-associated ferredoxin
MDACLDRSDCQTCPGHVVCHCLQVTEETILHALAVFELRTLKDVRQHTGAGDGCTACHRRLRHLLGRQEGAAQSPSSSASPI